jgi:hypothetical protein
VRCLATHVTLTFFSSYSWVFFVLRAGRNERRAALIIPRCCVFLKIRPGAGRSAAAADNSALLRLFEDSPGGCRTGILFGVAVP